MIPLALLVLAATPPGVAPGPRVVPRASVVRPDTLVLTHTEITTKTIKIPQSFAPAVMPYFRCLAEHGGATFDQSGRRIASEGSGPDCTASRKIAIAGADKMLQRAGTGSADARRQQIETTLRSVEDFVTPPGDQPQPQDNHAKS